MRPLRRDEHWLAKTLWRTFRSRGRKRWNGRCGLQSWTRRDTDGLATMFVILREEALVVMTMTGVELYGEEGRYV